MAISFYDKGELSSGFYGWRVVATIRGKRYQKYFSLNRPSSDIPETLWHQYQHLRARYYEARWMARSAAVQYIDFIGTEHAATRPHRGVGFHGITLGIGLGNRCHNAQCYFSVNAKGKPTRVWITEDRNLTQAWHKAVDLWGEVFDTRPKDIAEKRDTVPTADQFKALRKHLNDEEGADLSVDVLHHVYAEQRDELARKKVEVTAKTESRDEDLLGFGAQLQREMEDYLGSRGR